jgi:hypothetical protein
VSINAPEGLVYKHFTGGGINIPLCIDYNSLAALLGKGIGLEIDPSSPIVTE